MWTAVRAALKVYGIVLVLLVAAGLVGWQFVAPPPPRDITIAAGPEGGTYLATAKRWAALLSRHGIEARVLTTRGSAENLDLVDAGPPRADIAIVQGGVGGEELHPKLTSLGAIAYEAVWVFHRAGQSATRLAELAGARVAIGPEGSGTRVLAMQLIEGSGASGVEALPLAGMDAAQALAAGEIDAAVFVAATPTPAILSLLRDPAVALLDFSARAQAYRTAFPFLTDVPLPAGSASLSEDLPGEPVTLLAPVVQVVARDGIHPQIVTLLLEVLTETQRARQFFAPAGTFPASGPTDWPLHDDAERHYRFGPGILHRYLPFWVAVTIERTWVLIIPLLTILIPLSRIAPPLFRWQIERKIYRWYRDVRTVEHAFEEGEAARETLLYRLDRVADRVSSTHVPLSYARALYDLRQHIEFVRGRIAGTDGSEPVEPGLPVETPRHQARE
ncbi:TAXI family TRAP transporter solute-binding subunit [Elioraea rosea]|uniref:TAXI family TRAP transporter solute-binding subunit n=1 Tax=Elioraea rosea TaxID=2492390 RepID=UPI00118268D7|nr:TAXI family TRAP transporter solute-binding subunit [Elioraea rosea]